MNLFSLRTIICLLYIKISFLTFIPSGINQLNNLLYLQKISYFDYQINMNQCSLVEGPYCYYTEHFYIKSLKRENQFFKREYIEKDWISLYNDINIYSYEEIYNILENKIKNYYTYMVNEKDNNEIPMQEYQIILSFEQYDSLTIKADIFLTKMTTIQFMEKIILVMDGKIRLKYDKSKAVSNNIKDYPSKTYAIIESSFATMSLNGKKFRLVSFYVRPKNIYEGNSNYKVKIIGSMTKNIAIEGYINNKMMFNANFQFSYSDIKQWNKIYINTDIFFDKIRLPGNIEIDNIILSVEGNFVYDVQSLFFNDPKKKTVDLIDDSDI